MYCNKVKKGKHCINYTLQLNFTKLNLDVCKEDIPILGGQNSPMFWLFHSLHECALPRSETGIRGSDDSLWHGSKWGCRFDRIPAHVITQEVLACSFDTDFNYSLF